jgi:hypothetical protein
MFAVITTVFNFCGYASRYSLYRNFAKHMLMQGADLFTVEIVLNDQPFHVTEASNSKHFQYRTSSPLFYKEIALNLAVRSLPAQYTYFAFPDCDVQFLNDNWIEDSTKALQTYDQQPFT